MQCDRCKENISYTKGAYHCDTCGNDDDDEGYDLCKVCFGNKIEYKYIKCNLTKKNI